MMEMAGTDGRFDLDGQGYNSVRLRGNGLIWQKERMLNLALTHLPPECRKVVWADGDILFESSDWLSATSQALETHVVVQPFDSCARLPYGHLRYQGKTQDDIGITESFAACYARDPSLARNEAYRYHGSTGFAWAAQRDFLDACGFYDTCITGSNDHLMAHVFAGTLQSSCIASTVGNDNAYARHFGEWSSKAHALCQGRLGCVSGRVLHLWHGSWEKRRHFARNQELRTFDFHPARDLQLETNGLWDWAHASPILQALRSWSETHFHSLDEDVVPVASEAG